LVGGGRWPALGRGGLLSGHCLVAAGGVARHTGLGIAAGTGGVFALMLAVRRQWHQELTAADTTLDATERRVTELYTKAVEQLGSEKAPVRLGGLYALERLAQANPTQRQTVVNVLCAYLRMPYRAPQGSPATTHPTPVDTAGTAATASPAPTPESGEQDTTLDQRTQELQVRLAAQRILAHHLRPGPDLSHPLATFWSDSDIDLTGALLIDLDMGGCHARDVAFVGASFAGDAVFGEASFAENARFGRASFSDVGDLVGARFRSDLPAGELPTGLKLMADEPGWSVVCPSSPVDASSSGKTDE
jgi:hypothetical protein